MTRIGHLKKSTTLFPQRMKDNTARYGQNTSAVGSICSDEIWERKKYLESPSDMAGLEFSSASSIVPYKEYKKCLKSAVKCFLCTKLIKVEHLSEHLLFSEVECGKCNTVIKNCQDFQVWLVEKNMRGDLCEHVLEYSGDPMGKLKTCLAHDVHVKNSLLTDADINNLLRKYINGIKSLRNVLPWQQAIGEFIELDGNKQWHSQGDNFLMNKIVETVNQVQSSCVNELRTDLSSMSNACMQNSLENVVIERPKNIDTPEHIKSELSADNSSMLYKGDFGNIKRRKGSSTSKITGSSLNKQRKSGLDHAKKTKTKLCQGDKKKMTGAKRSKCSDYVETPADGFYYVVRQSVSECPNCYASLSPVDFSINIVTFLMTALCSECSLKIYIVQDPPDDSAPRICIITDQKAGTGKDAKITKTKKFKHNSLPEQ